MENLTSEILTQEQKLLEIKSKIITMDPELVEYTFFKIYAIIYLCLCGEIGRRAGLKIQ